jgi:hypothetical protein
MLTKETIKQVYSDMSEIAESKVEPDNEGMIAVALMAMIHDIENFNQNQKTEEEDKLKTSLIDEIEALKWKAHSIVNLTHQALGGPESEVEDRLRRILKIANECS